MPFRASQSGAPNHGRPINAVPGRPHTNPGYAKEIPDHALTTEICPGYVIMHMTFDSSKLSLPTCAAIDLSSSPPALLAYTSPHQSSTAAETLGSRLFPTDHFAPRTQIENQSRLLWLLAILQRPGHRFQAYTHDALIAHGYRRSNTILRTATALCCKLTPSSAISSHLHRIRDAACRALRTLPTSEPVLL